MRQSKSAVFYNRFEEYRADVEAVVYLSDGRTLISHRRGSMVFHYLGAKIGYRYHRLSDLAVYRSEYFLSEFIIDFLSKDGETCRELTVGAGDDAPVNKVRDHVVALVCISSEYDKKSVSRNGQH